MIWGSLPSLIGAQRAAQTLPVVYNFTARPPRATTMHSDAHNAGREEEHLAQLDRRRAAVAHQLRRLAIELAALDRQLDDCSEFASYSP